MTSCFYPTQCSRRSQPTEQSISMPKKTTRAITELMISLAWDEPFVFQWGVPGLIFSGNTFWVGVWNKTMYGIKKKIKKTDGTASASGISGHGLTWWWCGSRDNGLNGCDLPSFPGLSCPRHAALRDRPHPPFAITNTVLKFPKSSVTVSLSPS